MSATMATLLAPIIGAVLAAIFGGVSLLLSALIRRLNERITMAEKNHSELTVRVGNNEREIAAIAASVSQVSERQRELIETNSRISNSLNELLISLPTSYPSKSDFSQIITRLDAIAGEMRALPTREDLNAKADRETVEVQLSEIRSRLKERP